MRRWLARLARALARPWARPPLGGMDPEVAVVPLMQEDYVALLEGDEAWRATRIVMVGETPRCRSCAGRTRQRVIAHPVWDGPFDGAGSGSVDYRRIDYCPRCHRDALTPPPTGGVSSGEEWIQGRPVRLPWLDGLPIRLHHTLAARRAFQRIVSPITVWPPPAMAGRRRGRPNPLPEGWRCPFSLKGCQARDSVVAPECSLVVVCRSLEQLQRDQLTEAAQLFGGLARLDRRLAGEPPAGPEGAHE